MRRAMVVAVVVAGAAGCSGPAGEAPVELKPGLYAVKVEGRAAVTLGDRAQQADICLTPDNVVDFPRHPLARLVPRWPECREVSADPVGNTMSGKRLCRMDGDKRGEGSAILDFSGHHDTQSFAIDGTYVNGATEMPGAYTDAASGDFTITGRRIGDCR